MKQYIKKLITPSEAVIFGKDFGYLWKYGISRSILVGLTVLLAVLLPLMYIATIIAVPGEQSSGIANISRLIPDQYAGLNYQQELYYILISMICPLFFVLIPILGAAIPAALFFVGEKEQGTATSLLCTACTPQQVFRAKCTCAVVNSLVMTLVAFFCTIIIASIGSVYFQVPFFIDFTWVVSIFLLAPALSVFSALLIYRLSGKFRYTIEAVMTCGYVAMPLILLYVGQFAGLYSISGLVMQLIAIIVFMGDFILYNTAVKKLTAEKLI